MTTAFNNGQDGQPFVSLMSATFDGMMGQTIPPTPMPNNQMVPYQPNNQMILYQPEQHGRHSQTLTWKAKGRKEAEEEYRKIRKQVKHIAPAMFKEDGCDIFPQNAQDWTHFKYEMYGMRADELEDNAKKTKAMIAVLQKTPKDRRKIKSAFDGENGKEFLDGRGAVLSQPTIFSLSHVPADEGEEVGWPSQAELLEYGDNRENSNVGTRCGRFLPPPRKVGYPGESFLQKMIVQPAPLDRAGPIFDNGPSPAEMHSANLDMDNDEEFEEEARELVDDGLLKEIGLPNWSEVLNAPPVSRGMAALVKDFRGLRTI